MSLLEEMLTDLPREIMGVREIRVGPYLTSVSLAADRPGELRRVSRAGLASSMVHYQPGAEHRVSKSGSLKKLSAQDLARYLLSTNPLESAIGMATLNALLDISPDCIQGPSIVELVVERARKGRVAVVGHFPFVDKLREAVRELHVLELKPGQGDLPASMTQEILPRCRAVVLTATVLMNGTHAQIMPLCSDAFTVMTGPSTPPSSVLFRYGVDALAGSLVVDPDEVLSTVSQGGTYRDLRGVKKWLWVRERKGR